MSCSHKNLEFRKLMKDVAMYFCQDCGFYVFKPARLQALGSPEGDGE